MAGCKCFLFELFLMANCRLFSFLTFFLLFFHSRMASCMAFRFYKERNVEMWQVDVFLILLFFYYFLLSGMVSGMVLGFYTRRNVEIW